MPRKGVKTMRLLTEQLEKRFAEVGSQQGVEDPLIIAKFFDPVRWDIWYATEYDPTDQTFFGYVTTFGRQSDAWEYFSMEDLTSYDAHYDVAVVRDPDWTECRASKVIR